MTKITYLLGAGASANTIPVVNQMTQRIDIIKRNLSTHWNSSNIHPQNVPQQLHINLPILKSWIDDLDWLLSEAGHYYSIDTLARKYFLTSKIENLNRLKRCIILYFTIEQFCYIPSDKTDEFTKEKIDNRYDSFFAAISNIKKEFYINRDVKVLSWNYDIQIELCLMRYFENQGLLEIKKNFNIHPNDYSKNVKEEKLIESDTFGVVKLNGNALWNRNIERNYSIFDNDQADENQYTKPINKMRFRDQIAFLTKEYSLWDNDFWNKEFISHFNFAWEVNNEANYVTYDGHSNILTEALRIVEETQILVVIGYSFPVFNREIDVKLFGRLHKLRKIYIQDREPDKIKSTILNAFANIKEYDKNEPRLDVIYGEAFYNPSIVVSFQLEKNTDQFVIPFELHSD